LSVKPKTHLLQKGEGAEEYPSANRSAIFSGKLSFRSVVGEEGSKGRKESTALRLPGKGNPSTGREGSRRSDLQGICRGRCTTNTLGANTSEYKPLIACQKQKSMREGKNEISGKGWSIWERNNKKKKLARRGQQYQKRNGREGAAKKGRQRLI